MRSAYAEIAGRRRTVPVVMALGMLDPALEVLQVRDGRGQEYVTPEGLAKLKKQHATETAGCGEAGRRAGRLLRRRGPAMGLRQLTWPPIAATWPRPGAAADGH